jgi:hypothetical protein
VRGGVLMDPGKEVVFAHVQSIGEIRSPEDTKPPSHQDDELKDG